MPGSEQDTLIRLLGAGEGGPDGGAISDVVGVAGAGAADAAMLAYAAKLTRTPWRVEPSDVEALRAHGFDDRAIHDTCAVTAYYAFVNRIADGLGVELEDGRDEGARDGDSR
ncbi:MAG: hypothetical protein R3195_18745 [Gemmatimonadota bacterium]|nr:hypothetical protein [Gemmatimonadota bacterium]